MIYHHYFPCLGPHSLSCSPLVLAEDPRQSDLDPFDPLVVVLVAAAMAKVMILVVDSGSRLAFQMTLASHSGLELSGC